MKIKSFKHVNVKPDGTFTDQLGAVEVKGRIIMSSKNGGCGLGTCNCSEGHWISICEPRTKNGIMRGITVSFESQKEMDLFLKSREMICS